MEAELKFEREEKEGVAVVGTYLIDASRRLGVEVVAECGRLGLCDSCACTITSGAEFLTPLTKAENEQLSEERRSGGERLACQAKIEREGEIVVRTQEKKEEVKVDKAEEYRTEFTALPLDEKIAQLVKLEAIAIGETFNFILNSPYKIIGLGMDVLAKFGLKLEDEMKRATRPEEHQETPEPVTAETVAAETVVVEVDLETPIPADESVSETAAEAAETVEDNREVAEIVEETTEQNTEATGDGNTETQKKKTAE